MTAYDYSSLYGPGWTSVTADTTAGCTNSYITINGGGSSVVTISPAEPKDERTEAEKWLDDRIEEISVEL